ncbi:UNVERIFIED_CONTAM: alkaline phosphatase family protein [Prevotella sp. 15_C9]
MKKLSILLPLLIIALGLEAQVARPKLIVGLVVDQMRWDYLHLYNEEYAPDGLKRLLNDGFSFENTHINYAPTVTAVGHTSVFTGSIPAIHGIAGNYFADNDKFVYCCDDAEAQTVGSTSKEGKMSPRRMLTTTIGDQLKLATDFRSKVIGIALKDRAAILPAGHSADAAYWWDTSAGHFISSTYYMKELPQWVKDFNRIHHTARKFNIKTSNTGVTMTFQMAEAALFNEKLGQGNTTDMLTVSISSTDAIGHKYGTRGKENHDVFMQLDKDLAHFLNALDQQVGRGNYLLFLTADHGAAHNYNYLKKNNIPAGAFDYDKAVKQLNAHLEKTIGIAPVFGEDNYQFFLNDSIITKSGIAKQKVIDEAIAYLKQDPQYLYVFDEEKISEQTMPQWFRQRMENGYFRNRSGEIGIITRPQFFGAKDSPDYKGTSHGQPYPYDTHLPWLLYGWNIPRGASSQEATINDIAATICGMLKIQMPNGCIGRNLLK